MRPGPAFLAPGEEGGADGGGGEGDAVPDGGPDAADVGMEL